MAYQHVYSQHQLPSGQRLEKQTMEHHHAFNG